MDDLTKKALEVIHNKSYGSEGVNYFNLLIEYCLKVTPIEIDTSIKTAHVDFHKGYIIRYNPEFEDIQSEDDQIYIERISTMLAHEACHILFRHCSVPVKAEDSMKCMNIAMDSQINSYLWNTGYFKVFGEDVKHCTITQIVDYYRSISKIEGCIVIENPKINDDGTFTPPSFEGYPIGFEVEDDIPDWKVMYDFVRANIPEKLVAYPGELPGSSHSEWDTGAPERHTDRIFKGFADALNKELEDVEKELSKYFKDKNPLFEMKKIPEERLKSAWVRALSKEINGVHVSNCYRSTWNRFSRRLGEGYIGKCREKYQECSVFVDVSGSMSQEIPKAISHICSIATFLGRIKYFLTWDTEQCGEWFNINTKKLKSLQIGSRGGTSLGEGFKQLAKKGKTNLLIIISDMCTSPVDYEVLNELAKTHRIILGLVQSDISRAKDYFSGNIKIIPLWGDRS